MANNFTKAIYKLSNTLVSYSMVGIRRFRLSFIWQFKGRAKIGPRLMIRSIGGKVVFGDDVYIGPEVSIECSTGGELFVGKRVTINRGTFIVSRQLICIGDNVLIGEYCSIRDNDHEWSSVTTPIRDQGYSTKTVNIEDDVWIGRGAVIAKGVTIGKGAIIGANAVVTKDVTPFSVVVGVPAQKKRERTCSFNEI